MIGLGALGQLLGDVFLGAAQHEGLQARAQRGGRALVAVADRQLEAAPERRLRAEQPGLDEAEDRPQVAQRVLDRRTGHREPVVGLQAAHDLGDLRGRVLRVLRLVEHQRAEAEALEVLRVQARQRVRGDDDVVVVQRVVLGGPVAARLQPQRAQRRGELADLVLPGVRHRRRRDDQHRRVPLVLLALGDVRDELRGVVGDDELVQHEQPVGRVDRDALHLVLAGGLDADDRARGQVLRRRLVERALALQPERHVLRRQRHADPVRRLAGAQFALVAVLRRGLVARARHAAQRAHQERDVLGELVRGGDVLDDAVAVVDRAVRVEQPLQHAQPVRDARRLVRGRDELHRRAEAQQAKIVQRACNRASSITGL